MIVVDSSALVAILEEEPEAEHFLSILQEAGRRVASAVTVDETGIVLGRRRGWEIVAELNALVDLLGIEIVLFPRRKSWLHSMPTAAMARALIRKHALISGTAPLTRSPNR
jgi:uncharacterized protein with PIN domain